MILFSRLEVKTPLFSFSALPCGGCLAKIRGLFPESEERMDILIDLRSVFAGLMVAIAVGCQPIQPVPIGGQQPIFAAQPGCLSL